MERSNPPDKQFKEMIKKMLNEPRRRIYEHNKMLNKEVENIEDCFGVAKLPVLSNSLQPHELQPSRLLCSLDTPGKNTGMGCHSLLQGISLAQGLNQGLMHCRWILHH